MSSPIQITPRRHAYSVDDYHRMAEAGILRPGERVELINGEIIDMAPIGSRHAAAVNRIAQTLILALGDRAIVSVQSPVRLDVHSEPQPDIALLRPRNDFYANSHPQPDDVLLIVEVADSTSRFDREVKIPLYARHGIPVVWLVDVEDGQFTIYRDPSDQGYRNNELVTRLANIRVMGFEQTELNLIGLL